MHNMQESVKNIYKMPNRTKQMDMCSICTLFITNMISVYIIDVLLKHNGFFEVYKFVMDWFIHEMLCFYDNFIGLPVV